MLQVSLENICSVNSTKATEDSSFNGRSFHKAASDNYQNVNDLKWQYYASEDGLYTQYPASQIDSCTSNFDARFRPWLV